jgi:hypothetical protein
MVELTAEPFNLAQGTIVKARVEAKNIIGYSIPSDTNVSGADVRKAPNKPTTPVSRFDEGTTDTQITVYYPLITDTVESGGEALTSLEIWYDQGIGNWHVLNGQDPFPSLE